MIGSRKDVVRGALYDVAKANDAVFEEAQLTMDDDGCLVIGEGPAGTTILYPNGTLGMHVSQMLSANLAAAVFWFHIHDGDLWTYALFDNGEMIDQFSTRPDYWGEDGGDMGETIAGGDAEEIAKCIPGLSADNISQYLVVWSDRHYQGGVLEKAYPADRFHYGEDWQLLDFVAKLGLTYPVDERGATRGETCRFLPPAGKWF